MSRHALHVHAHSLHAALLCWQALVGRFLMFCPVLGGNQQSVVRAATPIQPGDVTPKGCPPLFVHKSGLGDMGVRAALANMKQLAASYGGKCGGVLL